ncbi:techylectin-5A-like [Homarus americanus]|uniref:techylectin-5A-like n=1 Tax=Homarus americanus TaxID=6706 RepID=UPI001C459423|nr:techylectin-5A-like [Homarus americanus]
MRVVWACLWTVVLGVCATTATQFQKEADVEDVNKAQEFRQAARLDEKDQELQEEDESLLQQNHPVDSFMTGSKNDAASSRISVNSNLRPVDCADYLMSGANTSGVYEIYPFTCACSSPVQVWCDMETDGGGWTVFLSRQRQSPQENFNRSWVDYKNGFGNVSGEHWLGNEILHKLTASRDYSLRLDMDYQSGALHYLTYASFSVANEASRYRVTRTGSSSGTVSSHCFYSGSSSFTTYDRDYDSYSGNCASVKGGGWWYYNCRYNNPTSPYNQGLNYTCYYNSVVRVSKLQLKIRPAICDSPIKTINANSYNCGGCE